MNHRKQINLGQDLVIEDSKWNAEDRQKHSKAAGKKQLVQAGKLELKGRDDM
jgi:hypothetical protein